MINEWGNIWISATPCLQYTMTMFIRVFNHIILSDILYCELVHCERDKITSISKEIFKCIFLNQTFRILINVSLNFILKGPIENDSAVFAWHQIGSKNQCWPWSTTLYGVPMRQCVKWVYKIATLLGVFAMSSIPSWLIYFYNLYETVATQFG